VAPHALLALVRALPPVRLATGGDVAHVALVRNLRAKKHTYQEVLGV
jgi:hypothetical protein